MTERRQSFKFLPTFPQKIYGAADTAEEVDLFSLPLSAVRFSQKTQWSTHEKNEENQKIGPRNSTDAALIERFLALLLIGLLLYPFFTAGFSIIGHKTGLSLIVPALETNS